jgi:hypothetical protein
MKKQTTAPRMSDAAYAGFLRLLLEPARTTPRQPEHAAEVDAYLRYLVARKPLCEAALFHGAGHAA